MAIEGFTAYVLTALRIRSRIKERISIVVESGEQQAVLLHCIYDYFRRLHDSRRKVPHRHVAGDVHL